MKKLLSLSLILFLTACGPGIPADSESGVSPNYIGNGFSVFVEQTGLNTYKFTVVKNEDHKGAIFTVYGLQDVSQIGNFNPATRKRLEHVADGHTPGDVFEVTFNSDDNVFIIYEDALVNGSFVYDTTKEMIRAQFRH